jgi:hypothetical protein
MAKYIDFEYLKQNNPCPNGIQFKGLFGDRSIGKTHGVLKHVWKTRKTGTAFLILRRNKLELNFQPFVTKYSAAFDTEWEIDSNMLLEKRVVSNDEKEVVNKNVIGYFSALSLAERNKHSNFDNPYITDIIVDEVFAEKPNVNEFQQLQTWITTVSRRTGFPFHPVTVWLLGNSDHGYSPILEGLGVFGFEGCKQKTTNGVYLFSEMNSPEGVLNVKNPLIKPHVIKPDNAPLISWSFKGRCFALYDFGHYVYIANVEKANMAYDGKVKDFVTRSIMLKDAIPPVYVSSYECLRFVLTPSARLE